MSVTVTDNSAEVMREFKEKVQKALGAIGEAAEGFAKRVCPVDTGRLHNSITYATKTEQSPANTDKKGSEDAKPSDYRKQATPEEDSVYIGTNVEYAMYVEFRDKLSHTSGKAHFLRDAATTHSNYYKSITEAIMRS